MITKEKNRTKIICTVITAVLAAVTGGSVLRLYNVQNVTQTVNGNVIQIWVKLVVISLLIWI